MVYLHDHGSEPQTIEDGGRIAQLVITPCLTAQFQSANELDGTRRESGGFGSTGRR